MKKSILIFSMIFVWILITEISISTIEYQINVETAFTDPYPVEPGKNLELSIIISNEGNSEVKNLIVELEPVEPFTILESPKKEIKSLNVGGSRIIDYNLFVDGSAVSAIYKIPVRIKYGIGNELMKDIEIRVQGTPKFELLSVSSERVSPGDQANIYVRIQNVGTGKAKRTTATLSSTTGYVKPVLSGGIAYLGDVSPGEKKRVKFTVLASPDSEYGVYSGNVNVSYEDESGNQLSESFDVGILVSGEPKLQIFKTEVDKESAELSVEIVNIGNAEAKAIDAKLIVDNKTFDVDYVTSIKIDKRATLKFILPSGTNGQLELSYEGPDNKEYNQIEIVTWNIPFTFPAWVWIIVIVVIAYVVWKKKIWKKIFKL